MLISFGIFMGVCLLIIILFMGLYFIPDWLTRRREAGRKQKKAIAIWGKAQVKQLIRLSSQGLSERKIAAIMGISDSTVHKMKTRLK